jgi:hypothetical protein
MEDNEKIVVFVGFLVFLVNVLQSINFIHDIPFFATTNFELNIFITINMQFSSIRQHLGALNQLHSLGE